MAVNGGDDPRRAKALLDAIALRPRHRRAARSARTDRPAAGSVALVGGGPGDPDLITVRGRRLVAAADVVVVDRLAPRELLDELPPDVEIIDCGKSAHRHNLTQDQINDVLVERALAGKRVVRLKGGDPFVFGRGGEEVLACVAAGVAVTVVPGVSSALAAPAAAGIPLTHRGLAADFTVVSGHLDPGRPPEDGMDWDYLANGPSTLVLLMAMDRLDKIARELIARGRDPHTPAAAIQNATLPPAAGCARRRWPSLPRRSPRPGWPLRRSWSSAPWWPRSNSNVRCWLDLSRRASLEQTFERPREGLDVARAAGSR